MTHSLWALPAGGRGEIRGFDDSLAEGYRIRLLELGFHPGEAVYCLQSPALGAPRVYRVANTVFALDDEVAARILLDGA